MSLQDALTVRTSAKTGQDTAPDDVTRMPVPVAELRRLIELHGAMGRELKAARLARRLDRAAVAGAAGFGSADAVSANERASTFTRASRLRPWLDLLGIDLEPFLRRYLEVIAPEAGDFPLSDQINAQRRADRPPAPAPLPGRPISREEALLRQATLGLELWRRRVAKGLTRPVLAERAGLAMRRVRQIERGLYKRRPTVGELWAITEALGAGAIWAPTLAKKYAGALAPAKPGDVGAPVGLPGRSPTGATAPETA